MAQSKEGQAGLEWIQALLSLEPRWTVEIDINSIKDEVELVLGTKCHQVTFLAQGGFNKLYTIQTDCEVLIMRVSLPVDPHLKTASEVATIAWVQCETTLPVPKVIAYKNHRDNFIGFEWILMTKLPGKALSESWESLHFEAKQGIVRQLAEHFSVMFNHQREGIGNLYPDEGDPVSAVEEAGSIGKMVSHDFWWGTRSEFGMSRGPFRSSKEWVTVRLSLIEKESFALMNRPGMDEDDLGDVQKTLRIARKLQDCIKLVFPDDAEELPVRSILFHDDVAQSNVLVDDNGGLTGIVDWECVSWVPLWKACDYPALLLDRPRTSKPDRADYASDTEEERNEIYWEHLMHYELTLLRDEFIDTMRLLQPEWVEVFEKSTLQRSFDFAIVNCDNPFLSRDIENWVEEVKKETGQVYDLYAQVSSG